MGYVERHLMPEEAVVTKTKVHWIVYMPGAFAILIGAALMAKRSDLPGAWGPAGGLLAVLIIVYGIMKSANAFLMRFSSEFALTSRRLVVKVGIIRRKSLELMLRKVESIYVNQSVLGRLLGYGTIKVIGTGGTADSFDRIAAPIAFRSYVNQQIESLAAKD